METLKLAATIVYPDHVWIGPGDEDHDPSISVIDGKLDGLHVRGQRVGDVVTYPRVNGDWHEFAGGGREFVTTSTEIDLILHLPVDSAEVDPDSAVADSIISLGASMIYAERQRQVTEEGYDAQHDDDLDRGVLIGAAVRRLEADGSVDELVKAGALIAAEVDRMLRAGYSSSLADPIDF